MVKICILGIHEGYTDSKWQIDNFNHYKIKDEIDDCVEFYDINTIDDLFALIKKHLSSNENINLKITDFYYTDSYVLQAIYLDSELYDPDHNMLGSQLIKESYTKNNILILKRNITVSTHDYISVTYDDIINSIKDTFVHQSIYNKPHDRPNHRPNHKFDVLEYINYPVERIIDKEFFESFGSQEYKVYDHTLTFYINTKTDRHSNNINKVCSVLYNKLIYGECYISLSDNSTFGVNNINLNDELIFMIYVLALYNIRLQEVSELENIKIDKSGLVINNNNNNNNDNHEEVNELNRNSFPYLTKQNNFYRVIKYIYTKCIDSGLINIKSELINKMTDDIIDRLKLDKSLNDIE